MVLILANPAHSFRECGVLNVVPCRYGWWRSSIAWHDIRRRCSASQPSWMLEDQHLVLLLLWIHSATINSWITDCLRRKWAAFHAITSHSPQTEPWSLRCTLWQQVNQHPHRRRASTQTDLHTSSYAALIIYPARSQTSVKWLQSDRETKLKAYLCGVFFLRFPCITGSSDSLNAQRQPSVVVCFPFSSAGACKDKTHIWLSFHAQLCQRALLLFLRLHFTARVAQESKSGQTLHIPHDRNSKQRLFL